jgi:hypothetical protein
MAKLYANDPYATFPYQEYALDLQGGPDDPLFQRLIHVVRPRVVIEVGSWKGTSAIRMAKLLKEQNADAAILCIDTWLGAVEHLTASVSVPGWDIRPYLKHGYPSLYYQFLANVMHSQCQDMIIPIPNTSVNAARWLLNQKIPADLIYVDASHEEDDVYQDLCHYWKLLRPGGIMFGDDWHAYWYGVICAVNRFIKERGLGLQIIDQKWLTKKPG